MLVSKNKLPRDVKQCMRRNSGYREKDIVNNANFVITANKGRSLVFYKKHKPVSKYDHTKYDTCQFDLKHCKFVG